MNNSRLFAIISWLGIQVGCALETPAVLYPGVERNAPGSWSFAVLPDTQKCTANHPELFAAQTRWIVDHAEERNIRFVLHVGDIVDANEPGQWDVAYDSLSVLDGEVPYLLALGNHDYEDNASTRETLFNDYFTGDLLDVIESTGGTYETGRLDNSYRLVETPAGQWLIMALEFGPRDQVLEWAGEVLEAYGSVPAVIATHAYLYSDNKRHDADAHPDQNHNPHDYGVAELAGGANDGQEMWDKLVSRHSNVVFVLNGHVIPHGVARLTSTRGDGASVHQLLANYQDDPMGGDAYLRLVELGSDGATAQVRTYSPYLDASRSEPDNEFELDMRATLVAQSGLRQSGVVSDNVSSPAPTVR